MYFTKVVKKLRKSIKSYGPENGLFGQNGHFWGIFSHNSPQGTRSRFSQGKCYLFHNKNIYMSPHFDQISEKLNGRIQSYCSKSVIFGHFGGFSPFEPLRP